MRCDNKDCGKEIESGSKFCIHCGNSQIPNTGLVDDQGDKQAADIRPSEKDSASDSDNLVIMRAGEEIWGVEESEGNIEPGKKRPTLIVGEEFTHLSGTSKALSMKELYERVNNIVNSINAPVNVNLAKARWLNDASEARERIVATLRDHPRNDFKMIMGLDYLGQWASFQIYIGFEPDKKKEDKKFELAKILGIVAAIGAAMLLLGIMSSTGGLIKIGALALAGAGLVYGYSKKKFIRRQLSEKNDATIRELEKHIVRSYKHDDMRLFRTAMQGVYESAIDDIVEYGGGDIVRVEGGKGKKYKGSSVNEAAPSTDLSDAAELDI